MFRVTAGLGQVWDAVTASSQTLQAPASRCPACRTDLSAPPSEQDTFCVGSRGAWVGFLPRSTWLAGVDSS